MATIAVNYSNILPISQANIHSVSLEDYNKLKLKYEKKRKENKMLKENLDSIMSSYEIISQSKKSVETIFETIKNLISTNKTLINNIHNNNKSKEDFATTSSHCEYLGIADMKTSARSTCNCSSSNIINVTKENNNNFNLLKKIEEMENAHNEILYSFNLLTKKYKIVKEEKEKFEQCNITLIDQIASLTEEYEKVCNELSEANVTIDRFKEIDKCLVDSAINSLFLNTNEKKSNKVNEENKPNIESDKNAKISDNNKNIGYVLCEPVPSFIKFINKFTK